VEHFYVTFGDPSCIGFLDTSWKADTHTNEGKNTSPVTAVGTGNDI